MGGGFLTDRSGRSIRVGLDIGGTKTEAVAVSAAGDVLGSVKRPSGWGADAVVAGIVSSVEELGNVVGFTHTDLQSVGIGIPGLVDAHTGRVLHAVNLGVSSLDLADRARGVLGVPVAVENDVKAAALGAAMLIGATGVMAFLNLGTGVAAGIVSSGKIWRGATGTAGEVGHISVDPHGRVCGCGQRGCIETFCGGGALAKAWGREGEFPVRDIFSAAEAGDPVAAALRSGLAYGAVAAVRVLVLTSGVDRVVIGGGVTALGDRLLADIREEVSADAARSPFMRSLRLDERIELLPTGSPAAAFGAALVGETCLEKEPVRHG